MDLGDGGSRFKKGMPLPPFFQDLQFITARQILTRQRKIVVHITKATTMMFHHSIVVRSAITNDDALFSLFPSCRHFILLLFLVLCVCWIEDTKSTAAEAAATTRESSSSLLHNTESFLLLSSSSSPRLFPAAALEQYSLASTVWRTVDPTNFSFAYHQQHDDHIRKYPMPILKLLQAAQDRFLQSLLMEDGGSSSSRDSNTFSFSASTSSSSTKSLLSNPNNRIRNHKNSSDNKITIVPLTCLWIEIADTSITVAEHGVDESYQLQIKDQHHHHHHHQYDETDHDTNRSCFSGARLSATTIFGILHGLTSFRQLLLRRPLSSTTTTRHHGHHPHHHHPHHHHQDYFVLQDTPLLITDAPRFPHRGLLIDTSRHYLSVSLILDTITAMAWNKLNVLHWHITDSQSWPLVLDTMPEVSQHGAYCPACVYTQHDVAHIRRHAWYHGIRVIPEVDVPGHIQSLGKSHPEWLSPCGYDDGTDTAAAAAAGSEERRSEPLDPTNEQVYQVFLPQLYHDLSTRLFPNTSMIHIGGDEVSLTCWNTSPTLQAWMKQHNMTDALDLWKLFERRLIQDILPQVPSFTTAIVWQEVFNEGLISNYSHSQQENYSSNNIKSTTTTTTTNVPQLVVDVWKGLDVTTIQQALQQDFAVLVSGCWYLDHLDQDWANMYKCNILSALNNTSSASSPSKLLWGGHASMWGERVDETDFSSRVWPRASAVAERLWSGYYNDTTTASNNNKKNDNSNSNINNRSNGVDFEASVEDRLDAFRCFLLSQGIAASPIRPGFCLRGHRGAFAVKHKLSHLAQT